MSPYTRTDADARRRWPRTATSIGSARIIDQLATRIAEAIISQRSQGALGDITDPVAVIGRLRRSIVQLLGLPEAPRWRFRLSPRGTGIEVDHVSLLTGWLTGTSLPDLADDHLTAAADPAWRIEQMVDAVSKHFEHYLAHAIAADLPADLEPVREQLRVQIARMGIAQWRTRYNASAAEVLDLLDFTRTRSRSLLRTLLETGSASVELPPLPATAPTGDGPLSVEPDRDEPHPAPLAVYAADQRIATIAAQDHADLQAILDTGLAITAELGGSTSEPVLSISLPLAD